VNKKGESKSAAVCQKTKPKGNWRKQEQQKTGNFQTKKKKGTGQGGGEKKPGIITQPRDPPARNFKERRTPGSKKGGEGKEKKSKHKNPVEGKSTKRYSRRRVLTAQATRAKELD